MKSNLIQLARQREELTMELSKVRRLALQANNRGDYRVIAKMTLEAARLNRAINDTDDEQMMAR